MESPLITAEAVSAVAMPALAQHYRVLSTPHVIINEAHALKGWIGEEQLLAAIQSAGE